LFQYDCIVVPELGGFILHYIPATFVEESSTYMPPRKKIAFNEALKLDDGLLINYMMLHEGLTRDEVFQVIRQFVDELKQEVRQQRMFTIEGLGLFSENEEGKLQFDPEIRHNFQGESYGFQPVSAQLVNAVVEEEKSVAVIKLPKESPIAVEAEEVPDNVVEMPVVHSRRQYLAWAAAVLLIFSLGIVSVRKSPSQVLSSLNPFELFVSDKEEPVAVQPVAESVVASVETKKAEPVAESVVLPVRTPVETPIVEPEPIKAKVIADPIAPVVLDSKKTEIYYLAIAGSFASELNARRLMRHLRREGFKTAYMLPHSTKKELIKVAAIGSTDRSEVVASLEKVSQLSGANAWVCKID
jgi:cell division septation protein DedD